MTEPSGEPSPTGEERGMPRWVKVSGLVAVVAIALVLLVLLFTGGDGGHGPGRHLPDSSGAGAGWPEPPAPEVASVHR